MRWSRTPPSERNNFIAWWTSSPQSNPLERFGFQNFENRLSNDSDFHSDFDTCLINFRKLGLNDRTLFFLCGQFFALPPEAAYPIERDLRKLRDSRESLKGLSASARFLEETAFPLLETMGRLEGKTLPDNYEVSPRFLRMIQKNLEAILNHEYYGKLAKKRGPTPQFKRHLLIDILPEYFRARATRMDWSAVYTILAMFGIDRGDIQNKDSLKQEELRLAKRHPAPTDSDRFNPLIFLDDNFRD